MTGAETALAGVLSAGIPALGYYLSTRRTQAGLDQAARLADQRDRARMVDEREARNWERLDEDLAEERAENARLRDRITELERQLRT